MFIKELVVSGVVRVRAGFSRTSNHHAMGCGRSAMTSESAAIDVALRQDAKAQRSVFKVLLLGAGDSGKSTFIKQMVLLHYGGFSELESKKAISSIQENIVSGLKGLAEAISPDDVKTPEEKKAYEFAMANPSENFDFTEWVPHIPVLWAIPAIKKALTDQYSLKANIPCGLEYFLNKLDKVLAPNFMPTTDDILRARSKTTGIQEYTFTIEDTGAIIKVVDVGGQRCERRKWMRQFDDIHLIVYFSSLNGYAMKMEEESKTNRLQDDLALFNSLMQLVSFKKSWLFLQNKKDIFAETIKEHPLDALFPSIPKDKACDYEYCCRFLESKFKEKWNGEKIVFSQTCALDADQMASIWSTLHKDLTLRLLNTNAMGI